MTQAILIPRSVATVTLGDSFKFPLELQEKMLKLKISRSQGSNDLSNSVAAILEKWMMAVIIILLGIFFTSRVYLVVEAFVSIRNLPVGAYSSVVWVAFLSHIG